MKTEEEYIVRSVTGLSVISSYSDWKCLRGQVVPVIWCLEAESLTASCAQMKAKLDSSMKEQHSLDSLVI